ncbi:MAG: universal stress protein [Bacillota bacterium]
MKKFLVVTDGSPSALKAVKTAAELVGNLPGASITLLTVGKPSHFLYSEGLVVAADVVQNMINLSEQQARKVVEESVAILNEHKIPCTTMVSVGDPRIEICAAACKGGYDLIIIGNRGRSALAGIVLGSVSSHVMRNAHCSVLVVK